MTTFNLCSSSREVEQKFFKILSNLVSLTLRRKVGKLQVALRVFKGNVNLGNPTKTNSKTISLAALLCSPLKQPSSSL